MEGNQATDYRFLPEGICPTHGPRPGDIWEIRKGPIFAIVLTLKNVTQTLRCIRIGLGAGALGKKQERRPPKKVARQEHAWGALV